MKTIRFARSLFLGALLIFCAAPAFAQTEQAIRLTVDATHAPFKIVRIHMVMPVAPGPLTLYYPKWIPGFHKPVGPVANVTGLKFSSEGKSIPWQRDLRDVFTFHLDVPAGSRQLDVTFDYVEPTGMTGGAAMGSATDKLVVVNWNQDVLYPAGAPVAKIMIQPTLLLPAGWKFGTALPVEKQAGGEVSFQTVALDRLVDSPVIAGEYYRVFDLTPPGEPIHHEIDVVADSEAALAMSPELQRGLTNIVAEAGKLFGARHYREYHFLLTLSDHTIHFGLEHHESNDSRLAERVLISPGAAREVASLLAHEYAHSWCGKFRRPQDLSTPDYQTPMETDLLWVYEGNTSYLGDLLAARSGMWTPEEYRESVAIMATNLGPARPGRTWRPLADTANAVPGMFGGGGWFNWQRGSDYYEEGELIWLEAANIIHDKSHGQKSNEDFLRAFFGGANNGPEVKPYTFDELVAAFNQVVPYDWASFFQERLRSTAAAAPLGGITASGWKLVLTGEPLSNFAANGPHSTPITLYSIGLSLAEDGTVGDSIHDGPAFKAGITPGMKVVGVNGRVYTPELLGDAILAAKNTVRPIQLLVVDDDYYRVCTVEYHEGTRYPHLERDESKPDYLSEMLKPLAK